MASPGEYQSPGSDHEEGPHEGGHDLQEGGWAMAEQVGDSEHEERDNEEDAGPRSDIYKNLNRVMCLTESKFLLIRLHTPSRLSG